VVVAAAATAGYYLKPSQPSEVRTVTLTEATLKPPEMLTVKTRGTPTSSQPWLVAQREGWFEQHNINLDHRVVDDEETIFRLGEADCVAIADWTVASFINDPEAPIDIYSLGSVGLGFYNGLFIRAADASLYNSLADLKGKKVGNPGWGAGATQALQGVMAADGLDMKSYFENVVGPPATLVDMLSKNQLDAALLYTSQTLQLTNDSNYKKLFNFYDYWGSKTGVPLALCIPTMFRDFANKNPNASQTVAAGWEWGCQYIHDHIDEFMQPGGKYNDLAQLAGWTKTEATAALMKQYIESNIQYTLGVPYDQKYIDSHMLFISSMAKAGLIPGTPDMKKIFRNPASWPGTTWP